MLFIIENALWKQSNTSSLILPVAVAVDLIVALVRELRAQFPHWEGRRGIENLFNDDCGGDGGHATEEI